MPRQRRLPPRVLEIRELEAAASASPRPIVDSGTGNSVREVIRVVEQVTGRPVPAPAAFGCGRSGRSPTAPVIAPRLSRWMVPQRQ